MPTYEYICESCGEKFDYFQSMSSPALKTHPDCKKENSIVNRLVSGGSGLIFKGSGFYLTDYKNKKKDPKVDKKTNKDSKEKSKPNKEKKKGKVEK